MANRLVLRIPDILGGPAEHLEELLGLRPLAAKGAVRIDLSAATWICPYGAVMLLGTCRYLAQLSRGPVQIAELQTAVHAYLRRVDFFERAAGIAFTNDPFDGTHELGRSPASTNVLELVPVSQVADVYEVANRARRILRYWLGGTSDDIDRVVSLLAEACNNIVDPSCDTGLVTIQKYERGSCVDVHLAILDMGIGIRRSLAAVHGKVAASAGGFIEQALAGLSARQGRGGQGLGAIQRIATASGGRLFIRSETGSALATPGALTINDGLAFFPGTQVAITFRSRWT